MVESKKGRLAMLFSLNRNKKTIRKNLFVYCGVVPLCALFGYIYETRAHGVLSWFMLLGFLVPLVLGLFPYLILTLTKTDKGPNSITSNIYNAAVATLTVGCYFKGFLDIYGTTRDIHLIIYSAVGGTMLLTGIIFYIISIIKSSDQVELNK